ncbi:unnamed protein product [Periconia digitata]|uniref:Rhodopsin domain-containing protein n=1 Tax=Periconia digitata TaxID=1303443 RepID=A0A9W4UHE7_9PLEO|nr:unnamed protein product [Periconia digitata]
MRNIPVEVLLSWPTPNYTNPKTRGNALLAVNLGFIVLVVTTVFLRLYTRIFIKRWFGIDDFLILLALIFTVALTTVVILANLRLGWDRHIYDIPLTSLAANLKIAMVAKCLFVSAATFTRLSILTFYYRLVTESAIKVFRWLVHISVAFNIAMLVSFILVGVFQCIPVSNYWMFAAPKGSCMDEGKATLCIGIINCVADFTCTILPIPLVARLQMPRRQRIAVIVLFGLGFIVTIAGAVRTWYIYMSLILEYDQTWYAYPLWIAAAVEIDLGVICASAPMLRPLLSRLPPVVSSLLSSRFKKSSGGGTYGTSLADNLESANQDNNTASHGSKSAVDPNQNLVPPPRAGNGRSYREPDVELKSWNQNTNADNYRASSSRSDEAFCRAISPIPPPPDVRTQHDRVSLYSDDSPILSDSWRV